MSLMLILPARPRVSATTWTRTGFARKIIMIYRFVSELLSQNLILRGQVTQLNELAIVAIGCHGHLSLASAVGRLEATVGKARRSCHSEVCCMFGSSSKGGKKRMTTKRVARQSRKMVNGRDEGFIEASTMAPRAETVAKTCRCSGRLRLEPLSGTLGPNRTSGGLRLTRLAQGFPLAAP